jgi:SAM-dependent methyltransferase
MTDTDTLNPPSLFVARWIQSLAAEFPQGRALDVACGRGRHTLALAARGFRSVGVDLQLGSLDHARTAAQARGLDIALVCADLAAMPLPRARFHVVVVTRYLDRRFFQALHESLVPGGVLLYETFTENQLRYGRGPRSRSHLLAPGELRTLVRGMEVMFDEEVTVPDALARIAARKKLLIADC